LDLIFFLRKGPSFHEQSEIQHSVVLQPLTTNSSVIPAEERRQIFADNIISSFSHTTRPIQIPSAQECIDHNSPPSNNHDLQRPPSLPHSLADQSDLQPLTFASATVSHTSNPIPSSTIVPSGTAAFITISSLHSHDDASWGHASDHDQDFHRSPRFGVHHAPDSTSENTLDIQENLQMGDPGLDTGIGVHLEGNEMHNLSIILI
jgi:hypothetical protein